MADIDIEKKKKPIWPWLLALLLVAVGVWIVVEVVDTVEEVQPTVVEGPSPAGDVLDTASAADEVPQDVEQYFTFVDDSANMGLPHQYTSSGLLKLAEALTAVVNKYDLRDQVEIDEATNIIRSKAQYIQKNPESPYHADSIKVAFQAVKTVLDDLAGHYPDVAGGEQEMDNQINELSPGVLTLEQKPVVKSFFEETQRVLKEMVERKPINI